MMSDYPEIGYTPQNLRHFIAQNGLLQKDVAAILGVNDRAVRAWVAETDTHTHRDMSVVMWRKLLAWQAEKS